MKRNYEVIIVGAGPAGATLAYELASSGIRVLVLEKATLPRYKCCAGGLTIKAVELLGTKFDDFVEDSISSAVVAFKGTGHHSRDYDQPVMYTVMREKFDYALVRRAEEAGADILQGLEACGIQLNDTGVEVATADGNFRSQFTVGADGARSIVARALGVKASNNNLIAIETEVLVDKDELAKWKSKIFIDLGYIQGGYAWLFPKSDHLSIGIACLAHKAKELKRRYWEFLNSLNLGRYTIARWEGGLIPVFAGQAIVTSGRAVLIGDAAGLVDPLTGEGLYNAIRSAQLAAPVIQRSLMSGEVGLNEYSKAVEEEILPEMRLAHMFSKVLSLLPARVFKLLKRDDRVWRGCYYLLRGEMNYSTIKKHISTLGGLYTLLFEGIRR